MRRSTRRWGIHSRVFATDPWPVIHRSITERCSGNRRAAAHAFLEQAKDYYTATEVASVSAAKPVLLYYGFLNLAKAYILTSGRRYVLGRAHHGLSEKLPDKGKPLFDAFLEAYPSKPSGRANIFDDFHRALGAPALKSTSVLPITELLPQVVPGHRLWSGARASNSERFISAARITFMESVSNPHVWIRLHMDAGDLTRLGVTHQRFLTESGLATAWREVAASAQEKRDNLLVFEPKRPVSYTGRAADVVQSTLSTLVPNLWTTVLSAPPYRKYYFYLAPASEQGSRLHQLGSIYALAYYLSSITRYFPEQFDKILEGEYAPFVEAFLNDQPTQFLYLLASEFAEREVTRAALV